MTSLSVSSLYGILNSSQVESFYQNDKGRLLIGLVTSYLDSRLKESKSNDTRVL